MPDFNPNEMDALFREGADRHEFKYNPDAWTLMEEKLDKKAKRRRIFFYLLGLFLLIGTITTYQIIDSNKQQDQKEFVTTILSTPINSENPKRDHENKFKAIIQNTTVDQETFTEKTKEYISSDSKERRGNIGAQNSFQSENTGNLMGHEIVSIDSQIEDKNVEELDQSGDLNKKISIHSDVILDDTKLILKNEMIDITSISSITQKPLEWKAYDLTALDLQIRPAIANASIPLSSNRWTVTVFANPEWSSVGLLKDSKVGWSFGGKFGYQFANKFEASVGIAYSRKVYKGGGEAYTMTGGWFDNIEPMRMDAKCDVIEVPLGLSYHLNGFRNSGFFADLGINSYMLHSEWYGFEYNDALVRPDRYMEVNEDSQNSHLIGVGRIAVGYQKVISKYSAFQVAPYVQFPLTGIGAGQVNVYSTGVQLAVKFNTQ